MTVLGPGLGGHVHLAHLLSPLGVGNTDLGGKLLEALWQQI